MKRLISIRLLLKNNWPILHLRKWGWLIKGNKIIVLIKLYRNRFRLGWLFCKLGCFLMRRSYTLWPIIALILNSWGKELGLGMDSFFRWKIKVLKGIHHFWGRLCGGCAILIQKKDWSVFKFKKLFGPIKTKYSIYENLTLTLST